MKKLIARISIFALVFGLLNGLLLWEPFQRWYYAKNPYDYFYTVHDWSLKLTYAQKLKDNTFIALGTSRTAHGVNPRQFSSGSFNLGLIAASHLQVYEMARRLKQYEIKSEIILVEVNPVALSGRFIEETRGANYQQVFERSFLETLLPDLWLVIPALRYQGVFSETFRQISAPVEHFVAKSETKKSYHFANFRATDLASNKGYIPQKPMLDLSLKQDLETNCMETSLWALQDFQPEKGLDYLRQTLISLRSVSKKIVIWIPPLSSIADGTNLQDVHHSISKIVETWGYPVLDFSKEKSDPALFNDCVHLNEMGAVYYTEKLKLELERQP